MPETSSWWRRHAPYLAAIALIVCLRVIGLGVYPQIEADEGGWPLSVRTWVETGVKTTDYYVAPGYHWLLGVPFRLFGATHAVGRLVSALVALLGLFLFHRLARRHAGPTVAFWAVLLLGTSYPAVLIDRRAFMEPFQLALMFALCLAAGIERLALRLAAVAALTALLMVTKATAAFLLPALVLSTFWASRDWTWPRRLQLTAALGAGALVAAGVFYWLYLNDPATFLAGWTKDIRAVNVPGVDAQAGRFRISPLSIERSLRWYADYEPFLLGVALLGFCKAIWERRHGLMSCWLALGAIHFCLQVYIQTNHRAMLLPPLCYLGAALLCELNERQLLPWARAALLLTICYGAARVTMGIATAPVGDHEAVAWLARRTDARSTVIAAPYVLMRLPARPVSFFTLAEPFLPTPDEVGKQQAGWLVTEPREWGQHLLLSGGSAAPFEKALADCCELAFKTPAAEVYRVKSRALAETPGVLPGQPAAKAGR